MHIPLHNKGEIETDEINKNEVDKDEIVDVNIAAEMEVAYRKTMLIYADTEEIIKTHTGRTGTKFGKTTTSKLLKQRKFKNDYKDKFADNIVVGERIYA